MSEYKKLSQSKVFQVALVAPTIFGTTLFLAALTANGSYKICFTSECIETFFNLYKYPLSIFGLAVPLSAIVAAIHRSDETAYQIKQTLAQNTFNNYAKHQEEFTNYLRNWKLSTTANSPNQPCFTGRYFLPTTTIALVRLLTERALSFSKIQEKW